MKRNFAIDLTTCSKKDRKEAIRLAKENGYEWLDSDMFRDGDWKLLFFYEESPLVFKNKLRYDEGYKSHNCVKISLPKDWDKFKEYIGIKDTKNVEKVEYVRRIGDNLYSCWHNRYKGHIFEVISIDSQKDCYVYVDFEDDCGHFIAYGYYEPATKEEYESQNNIDYKAKYYELKKELERLSKL